MEHDNTFCCAHPAKAGYTCKIEENFSTAKPPENLPAVRDLNAPTALACGRGDKVF